MRTSMFRKNLRKSVSERARAQMTNVLKVDRLQIIEVAKKYICVVTVHQ